MLIKAFFSVLLISVLFLSPGFAQEIFNGGDFSVDANWDSGTKPGPNADIVIAAGAFMNVNESYTCNSLTLNEFSSFSCSGGSILTIGTGGVFDQNGNLMIEINSSMEISSSIAIALPTFTDGRDGNTYKMTKIGNQVWMAENLAYLPSVSPPSVQSESASYYYVYGYSGTNVATAKSTANYSTYGVLYNWPAAVDGTTGSDANPSGIQGICPAGWHLPSYLEWNVLFNYLGANGHLDEEGVALKSTSGWNNNGNGTDEYGFSGLPSGYLITTGFFNLGIWGQWWSSSGVIGNAFYWELYYSNDWFDFADDPTEYGFGVRCVRD